MARTADGGEEKSRLRRALRRTAAVFHILFIALQALAAFGAASALIAMLYGSDRDSAAGIFLSAASLASAALSALLALFCLILNRFATRFLHYSSDIAASVLLILSAALAIASIAGGRSVSGYVFILVQPLFPVIELYGFEKNKMIKNRRKERNSAP